MWPWIIGAAAVVVSGGVIRTIVKKRNKQSDLSAELKHTTWKENGHDTLDHWRCRGGRFSRHSRNRQQKA